MMQTHSTSVIHPISQRFSAVELHTCLVELQAQLKGLCKELHELMSKNTSESIQN